MTRAEAIKILWQYDVNFEHYPAEDVMHAIDMAIEALEQIESGRYLKGECSICRKEYGTLGCCTTVSNHWVYSCKEGMAQYAEALEQEPKRGKWIVDRYCSECEWDKQEASYTSGWRENYCPNCGAKMEVEEC